jgi:alpha-tubulin suppressor-like RCC1 family protein
MEPTGTHKLLIDTKGSVHALGQNFDGQLGTGDKIQRTSWTKIDIPTKMIQVSVGDFHSVGVAEDGSLWGWGLNRRGQAGHGTMIGSISVPTKILNAVDFISVCAGDSFTIALDLNGVVWSFGINDQGQLGLELTTKKVTVPTRIETLYSEASIKMIACGGAHSLALDSFGNVWSWGLNGFGQLGLSSMISEFTPRKIPCDIPITYVASGHIHSAIIDAQGNLFTFGGNLCGQLGLGNYVCRNAPTLVESARACIAVWCGFTRTIFQTESGNMFFCGCNTGNTIHHTYASVLQVTEKPEWFGLDILTFPRGLVGVDKEGNAIPISYDKSSLDPHGLAAIKVIPHTKGNHASRIMTKNARTNS